MNRSNENKEIDKWMNESKAEISNAKSTKKLNKINISLSKLQFGKKINCFLQNCK